MSAPLDTDNSISTELVDLRRQVFELQQALANAERPTPVHVSALAPPQVGTWEWEDRTNRVIWSPETEQIFGLSPGAFDGTYQRFFTLVHPNDRQRLGAAIAKAVEDRSPYRIEHRIITPNGAVRWVACRGHAMSRENEPGTTMAGTMEDITARKELELAKQDQRDALEAQVLEHTTDLEQAVIDLKQEVERRQLAESALKVSEQRYQSLYEQNPFMYFTLTVEGTVLSVNSFGADQLGYQKEDLIGQSILKVFDRKDQPTVLTQIKACAASPYRVFQWEIQKLRNDGTRLWVKERARAIHDQTKQLLVLISCEDITERREAEEQLRESEARWRTLYEHAGVGIAQLDLDGRFLRVNPRLCATLGYSPEMLIQHTFQEFTHPDDLAANLHYLDELLTGKRPSFSMEKRYRRSDNTWVWVDFTMSVVRAGSGEPAYFIAVIQHINDRKHAEEQLRDSEQAIRSLLEATSHPGLTLNERIQTVLELGCRRFWLPIGLVTGATGDQLKLLHVWAPSTTFDADMHLPLDESYCGETMKAKRVIAFEHARTSKWANHPSYKKLGFECYIGAPLTDRGHLHGTICFTGPKPYPRRFTQADKDFLQLMARWVSGELVRNESEQAVKEQEALLRSVIETATDAIFMKDCEGRYQFINSAGALVIGKPSAEIIGKKDDEIFPQDTANRLMTDDQEVFSGSAQRRFEDVVPLSGDPRTFYSIKTPHRDQNGQIVGLVGVARDMTALQRAEAALRLSEERFKVAFRSSPHPVIITELTSGHCLEVNDASLKLFGYDREEVIGQTTISLGIWPTLEDRAQFFQELRKNGAIRNREISLRTKDRKTRVLLVSSEVIELDGASCLITVGHDMTEHKLAEEALRASELRLQHFVAEAPVGLCILDEHWRVVSANKALCELTGYDEHEIVGSTYALYTHPEDLAANIVLTDEFFRGVRAEYTYEKRYIRKSGEIIWVSVKTTRVELSGYTGPLLLAAVQDITERKLAMEEREHLSRDLHDNILQSLYAIGMQLEAGKLSMGKSPRRSKVYLSQAVDQLNNLMLDVRRFITLLTQRTMAELDFGQALRQLIESTSGTGHSTPDLEITSPVLSFITPKLGEQLLNIVREALSNSTRHAHASRRWVQLGLVDNAIHLIIGDNGVGFSTKRKRRAGHGLGNMAARAKEISASFTLKSVRGKGTMVLIKVPLKKGHVYE
jgi:PAS domain S-box-containing protein